MDRNSTWSNIGVTASSNNFDELMNNADLNYNVVLRDAYILNSNNEYNMIPHKKVTIREDNNRIFGIVSDRYKVCQNSEALDFVRYIDGIELVKAGQLDSGLVYMIAQLPEVNVLGDNIKPHLIFQNSHDGSGSVRTTITLLRIACQNQFTRSFANSPATVSIPHVGDITKKLEVAKNTISRVYDYIENYKSEAEELVNKKITPERLNKIIGEFFSTKPEYNESQNIKVLEDRSRFITAFKMDDNENFKRTMWGLVNAYSDFITHYEPSRKVSNWEENRFSRNLNSSTFDKFVDLCKIA